MCNILITYTVTVHYKHVCFVSILLSNMNLVILRVFKSAKCDTTHMYMLKLYNFLVIIKFISSIFTSSHDVNSCNFQSH